MRIYSMHRCTIIHWVMREWLNIIMYSVYIYTVIQWVMRPWYSLIIDNVWLYRGYRHSARLLGASCWQQNRGAIRRKKLHGNRKRVVEWTVGVWEDTDSWLKAPVGASSRTKYKRSKNVFAVTSIALTLQRLGTPLLQLPAQSLIGSLGTLVVCMD